jgi:hypothetical protein
LQVYQGVVMKVIHTFQVRFLVASFLTTVVAPLLMPSYASAATRIDEITITAPRPVDPNVEAFFNALDQAVNAANLQAMESQNAAPLDVADAAERAQCTKDASGVTTSVVSRNLAANKAAAAYMTAQGAGTQGGPAITSFTGSYLRVVYVDGSSEVWKIEKPVQMNMPNKEIVGLNPVPNTQTPADPNVSAACTS